MTWCKTDEKTRELGQYLKTQSLILFRHNLIFDSVNKAIEDIKFSDFLSILSENQRISNFIVFIDNNGDTRILKNRWGALGTIRYKL